MRLIDADALIADIEERYCKPCKAKGEDYNEVRCRACWVDDAIGEVDGFGDNAIDAVEVVRCKECNHWLNDHICTKWSGYYGTIETFADDFCSYGERKESE